MKFKALEWSVSADGERFAAPSPAGFEGYLVFYYNEGQFWDGWDLDSVSSDNPDEIKARAQAFHEAKLAEMFSRWIEQ